MAIGPAFLARAFAAGPVTVGPGPYGPLQPFNADGIALPAGFTSRELARGGSVVAGGGVPYTWHNATDGQATFPTLTTGQPDGGWILVANSEVPGAGGVSGVEFAPDGSVERAYRVLAPVGVSSNCAGGPTPWGMWLSCEEHDEGMVHECDPATPVPQDALTTRRPMMGVFAHEAAAVDPVGMRVYLTEDKGDGCLYRFTPTTYPDLNAGLLEVAVGTNGPDGVALPGTLTWATVPQPLGGAANPTRTQVASAAHFEGGEGIWFDDGTIYFTSKGDGRVWTLDTASSQLDVLYDPGEVGPDAPLSGVDNITVSPSGDIYVCEDGADHDICMITPDFQVTRFLKLHPGIHSGPPEGNPVEDNETVGVVFSPDGTRMYFGAQRSFGVGGNPNIPAGVVYEVRGPFRQTASNGNGGGGGGTGGGSAATPRDLAAPGMLLRSRRRRLIRKLLDRGFPIRVELDELAGLDATLKVGRKLIARATTSVAVRDRVGLALRPSAKAAGLLDGREEVVAKLKVTATDAAGNKTVRTRRVRLLGGG